MGGGGGAVPVEAFNAPRENLKLMVNVSQVQAENVARLERAAGVSGQGCGKGGDPYSYGDPGGGPVSPGGVWQAGRAVCRGHTIPCLSKRRQGSFVIDLLDQSLSLDRSHLDQTKSFLIFTRPANK